MLKTSGCRKCGGRPMPKSESVFKLCQHDIDVLSRYVHESMHDESRFQYMPLPGRAAVMRQRYRAAVRLLGW